MGPAALETFLLAGDGESRALACDNGTFREIVLLYLRSMRRDPDLKAQLLMLCLEGWEAQPEKKCRLYAADEADPAGLPALRRPLHSDWRRAILGTAAGRRVGDP